MTLIKLLRLIDSEAMVVIRYNATEVVIGASSNLATKFVLASFLQDLTVKYINHKKDHIEIKVG